MDNTILKKRLSSFRTSKGQFRDVSDELLVDVLRAWESWPGTSKDFYQSIGATQRQMASIMGKAKKVSREGHYPAEEFKEVKIEGPASYGGVGIELCLDGGKVVRFSGVDQVIEFLKKTATVGS